MCIRIEEDKEGNRETQDLRDNELEDKYGYCQNYTVQCKNLVSDCFHVGSVQNSVRNVQGVLSPSQPATSDQPSAGLPAAAQGTTAASHQQPAAMKTLLWTATPSQTPVILDRRTFSKEAWLIFRI